MRDVARDPRNDTLFDPLAVAPETDRNRVRRVASGREITELALD